MKKIIGSAILFFLFTTAPGFCGKLEDLFASIEALNIQRQGYTLCKTLSLEQQAYAQKHMEEASSKNVYRFRDKTLNIVADPKTHRVLVMFEQFDKIDQSEVQNRVGDLFMTYGEPTISAHDKVVYWAWTKEEKVTADQYKTAKEKKKRLDIIATVKLNSEIKIMEKSEEKEMGDAYYIISSDPLLQFFK